MARGTQPSEQMTDDGMLLFDHYEVEHVLGRGAMGVVYLARDVRIGRRVALKTLNDRKSRTGEDSGGRDFVERFRREAEVCGSLVHPNIVTLYDVGYESRNVSYLAMEFVEGESLLSLLRRRQKLPVEVALRIADDVLQGLAYAHARGVIHRDIKPANILVTLEGSAKITDFGIARAARQSGGDLTEAGQLLGTPHYMAPEHIAGRGVGPQSDIFSLGVVLFEMLTGRKPFDGADIFDVLYRVVNQPTPEIGPIAPDVPHWAASFVKRLLEKAPSERFLSAAVASREIKRLLAIHHAESFEEPVEIPVEFSSPPEDTPTTPIFAQTLRGLRSPFRFLQKNVRTSLAVSVITIALVALVAGAMSVQYSIVSQEPVGMFSDAQLSEFAEKKAALREAQVLLEAGAYLESWKRFEKYLERYPGSPAAIEGRDRARAAIEQMRAAGVSVTDLSKPSPPKQPPTQRAATSTQRGDDHVSWWGRMKRFFRGR